MDIVILSRLQFAITTLYHFLFIPLTLGLAFFIAVLETMYVKTDNVKYKEMAKFWGKLFLVNFSMSSKEEVNVQLFDIDTVDQVIIKEKIE